MTFEIPIKTCCSLNSRMHYMQRARMVKAERDAARLMAKAELGSNGHKGRIPSSVKLTRKFCGVALDDDNVCGYLKGCRDGIADAIGIDDGDARIVWQYDQLRVKKRSDFGVIVEMRFVGEA